MSRLHELLSTLVAFDTTSRNSNLPLLDVVASLLDEHGLPHERVMDATGTKANLIARIGPDVPGGIVLTGHTDCVPVDGQPWSRDPFVLHEDGSKLFGRGTSDMKGFIACVLDRLDAMAAAELTKPILLVFTYDEEVGTIGAPSGVEGLLRAHATPAAVIVGEPTLMRPVTAHKGVRAFTTTVSGLDGHSSQPQLAANAIGALSRIATYIDDLATAHREAAADPRFDPPYTTFNLAMIDGGQALNIIPRHAELVWEYRPVPADDTLAIAEDVERFARDEVLPRLRAATGIGEVEFRLDAFARGLDAETDGAAEALVRQLTGSTAPAGTVPFGTDGGHFQAAGLSTVVCGPGSIEQAHQPDEWIEASELDACTDFLDRLIARLAAD